MPKLLTIAFLLSVLIASAVFPQSQADYYSQQFYLTGAAGAGSNGLLGYANPANLNGLRGGNLRYYWLGSRETTLLPESWGVFTGTHNLGFGMVRLRNPAAGTSEMMRYRVAMAGGNRRIATGFAYAFSSGDSRAFGYRNQLTGSFLLRPTSRLSLGAIANFWSGGHREGVLELGLRPLGSARLTLFADAALARGQSFNDARWSAGADLALLPGLNLSGRYFDSDAFTLGMTVSFGHAHTTGQSHFGNSKRQFNTYSVGVGDFRPALLSPLFNNKGYVSLALNGRIDYQKYQLFDDNTRRFMDVLQDISVASGDPRIEVIALNLAGLRVLPEHAWEIREALRTARAGGKKVIIFFENAGMTAYHLASVADRIMMDPMGSLRLPGYVFGGTYLKGTLDKLGLGFDEWRFYKYKSFLETYSREDMSAADREQRLAVARTFYQTVRSEVSRERNIPPRQFDHLVDEHAFFMAEDALQQELVDTLCRWDDLQKVIRSLTAKKKMRLPMAMLRDAADADLNWGEPPQVAVVYALGECAMDSGIRARWLGKTLRELAGDGQVKAVVLRVDSPGGDGMASDVVAEALRECAKKKPVIVSQGQVAASGGYWISMYADTIIAAPTTITGSIGVIAGWVYDKGLGEKLGMTADRVQVGEHADLTSGIRLPLLGITVPARNLTSAERGRAEKIVRSLYRVFVEKVAEARDLTVDSVKVIAQGRVWSGEDALGKGLVDAQGGLLFAIEMARRKAGIPPHQKISLREMPKYKGLLKFDMFSPPSIHQSLGSEPVIRFIRMMNNYPGHPLPLLLPGEYPELE